MEQVVVEGEYSGRVLQLEKEVHHIGSEVHKQSSAIGELRAGQNAHQRSIEKIGANIEKLIDQKVNNPVFTPGLAVTIVAGIFALFFGIAQYVEMQNDGQDIMIETVLETVKEDRQANAEHFRLIEQWRAESHYETASQRGFQERMNTNRLEDRAREQHMDERFHALEDRVADTQTQVTQNRTSIRAIGDYVKEHANDNHTECFTKP